MKILCKIHNSIENALLSNEKISNRIWCIPVVLIVVFIVLNIFNFTTGIFFIDVYLTTFFVSSIIYSFVFVAILKAKDIEIIKKSLACIGCILFLITIVYFLILSPILFVAFALLYFYSEKQDDDPFEVIDSLIYILIIVAYFIIMYLGICYFLYAIQVNFFCNYFVKYFIVNLIVFFISFVVKYLYKKFKLKNMKSLYFENLHLFLMFLLFFSMFVYGNIYQFEHYNEFNNACSALSLFITAITKKHE